MKRFFILYSLFFLLSSLVVYAQRMPSVGVMDFESRGAGVTAANVATITSRVYDELASWGTISVVRGDSADYVIRATIIRQGQNFIVTGETLQTQGNRVLNEYTETIPINNIQVYTFCARAVERVPFPNYLAGTWQSVLNMPDGPVVCIIEFRSNRTVHVERYDTWEHRQNNSLRYEGFGEGTYTYIGYANRTMNVGGQQIRVDATFSVNLSLEETLPDQTEVNSGRLNISFNENKTAFTILNGMLPCGRNYDGPSVYPSEHLGFTSFTKIR